MNGALLGALGGLFEAIGLAVDGDDLGIVDEAVDHGDDAGGVGEDLVPVGEVAIGGDQGAFGLVSSADELEQEVGVAVGVGEVPDLVDDQERGSCVVSQASA